MHSELKNGSGSNIALYNRWVFAALWVLAFVLYFPAAQAGWVIDGVGFLYNLRHETFWAFLNRTYSSDQSFYQLFTLHYFLFYALWGMNVYLWSLLYITTHAINCYLLFKLVSNLFADSGVARPRRMAIIGILIFAVSPHISEILICRAYFHYLLSYLLILQCLLLVQRYQHRQHTRYLAGALLLYLLCLFTLEIFYLLPLLVAAMALYYRFALGYDRKIFRQTIKWVVWPQLLWLALYFIALVAVYKHLKPHKIEMGEGVADYLSRLPKYLFHILVLGRYFPVSIKKLVYAFFASWPAIIVVYGLLAWAFWRLWAGVAALRPARKAIALLATWALLMLLFVIPLAFPGPDLLVFYDRYTYFALPFIFVILTLLVAPLVRKKFVAVLLFCAYADCNLFCTLEVNTAWIDSDKINRSLLHSLPAPGNRIVLLLNIPENMNGAPMIGAQPEGNFKMMREIYTDSIIPNPIYDVASYNMFADYNGAHVFVLNDSTVNVVINHVGTWWWYAGHGAATYENTEYRADFDKVPLGYQLTLKHPAGRYMMLYSVGGQWKEVNWGLKNRQQD